MVVVFCDNDLWFALKLSPSSFILLHSVLREVESIIGSMWKEMTNDDKQLWKQKATEQNNRVTALAVVFLLLVRD